MERVISWEEVAQHGPQNQPWIVIENVVYDVSRYMKLHPGGPIVLMARAGKDATYSFQQAAHSEQARLKILPEQTIGHIASGSSPTEEQREQPPSKLPLLALLFVLLLVGILLLYLSP